jgi:hypothetical protein
VPQPREQNGLREDEQSGNDTEDRVGGERYAGGASDGGGADRALARQRAHGLA